MLNIKQFYLCLYAYRPANKYRQLTQYRDLDAPQEPVDLFN